MAGTTPSEGQAQEPGTEVAPGTAPSPATQAPATNVESGQPAPPSEPITQPGTAAAPEPESFFDPDSIKGKPELELAYKDMQRAFTRGMERNKVDEQAIASYKAFQSDPHGMAEKIAAQLGYTLTPRNQGQPQGGNGQAELQNFEPQTWDDVVKEVHQRTMESVLGQVQQRLEPFLSELKDVRKSTLEQQLDQNCPDWRTYEPQMMEQLKEHPTLVRDPVKLYQLSLPPEVLESRATQKAIAKLKRSTETQPSAGSTTTRQVSDDPRGSTFGDAVKWAKADLASRGVTGPWNQ